MDFLTSEVKHIVTWKLLECLPQNVQPFQKFPRDNCDNVFTKPSHLKIHTKCQNSIVLTQKNTTSLSIYSILTWTFKWEKLVNTLSQLSHGNIWNVCHKMCTLWQTWLHILWQTFQKFPCDNCDICYLLSWGIMLSNCPWISWSCFKPIQSQSILNIFLWRC